jgi:hypothetical protein
MKRKSATGIKKSKSKKVPKAIRQLEQLFRPVGVTGEPRTVYDPKFHPIDFVQHCKEGTTKTEICAAWGVASSTVLRWSKIHPDFKIAYRLGAEAHAAFWHLRARQNILGERKAFNQFGFIWYSKNTMGWSDQGRDEYQGSLAVDYDFHDQATNKSYDGNLNEKNDEDVA